ncbi:acyl-CoA dehydrogenase [Comamonas composti]|uniref:acyl-CoA dehydrogenase n=1 Tax=Comamonas composti TaxID=408558 RepID=UPI00040E2107|nr:acyl-CoA dehydrogenase [Comamonas composti]
MPQDKDHAAPAYAAPIHELMFVLHEWLGVEAGLRALPPHAHIGAQDMDSLLVQLARFAQDELAALNLSGDQQGCRYEDGLVHAPAGFAQAYRDFCRRGWPGLGAAKEYGGQALPTVLTHLVTELMGSANHAWLMYTSMSRGGYACIEANGTTAQKARYLPPLTSGHWTSSMCITEDQAGTDVGLLQTRAVPQPDGSYRLWGHKRMATNAEHDLSDNILHLVLARIEGAPEGVRGLSLFIAPKFLPDDAGRPGVRNAVRCTALEDKMGIRATPTCRMQFDGARAELLGQPQRGLQAMFVMMNIARLATGMQGVNQAERAYQLSSAYAQQRLQGRSARGPANPQAAADPLVVHADVRRMLLTQRAWLEAGRAFGYWVALRVDQSLCHPDAQLRDEAAAQVALLTPVLKAFATDNGYACATLAQQVLGGWGYLNASGASQFIRDVRVGQIYEGANGIQGQDLLGRKVLGDGGQALRSFVDMVRSALSRVPADSALQAHVRAVDDLCERLNALTEDLAARVVQDPDQLGASASSYLRLLGHLVYGWIWIDMARVSEAAAGSSVFHAGKVSCAHFYFAHLFPEVEHLLRAAMAPAGLLALAGCATQEFTHPGQNA